MDYETLDSSNQKKVNQTGTLTRCSDRDDFSSMLIDLLRRVNLKVAILLFLVGIFIFSDIFIEMILSKFSGTVDGFETTTKGTILQLLFMSISYIILDLLIQGDIL